MRFECRPMGTLPGIGLVWYNPNSTANILSAAHVRRSGRHLTMDTAEAPVIHLHKIDGSGTTVFYEHESGLYLHDITQQTNERTT